VRKPTSASSVFFDGMARTPWTCWRHEGTRCSTKWAKDLIAARRALRERGELARVFSRFLEKREDQRYVELLEHQRRRPGAQPRRGEGEQQAKGVRIGIAGVHAGAALPRKTLAEEGCQVVSQRRHRAPRVASDSLCAATSARSRGVACKYQ